MHDWKEMYRDPEPEQLDFFGNPKEHHLLRNFGWFALGAAAMFMIALAIGYYL